MMGSKPIVMKDLVQTLAHWQLATYTKEQLRKWRKDKWITANQYMTAILIKAEAIGKQSDTYSASKQFEDLLDNQEL